MGRKMGNKELSKKLREWVISHHTKEEMLKGLTEYYGGDEIPRESLKEIDKWAIKSS